MEIYLGRRETLEVEKTIMTTNSIIKKTNTDKQGIGALQ